MSHRDREAQLNSAVVSTFRGFYAPTSNTTYCPNQFFDVCMPNASRGCLRLVAYLLRKTLGWCDEHGHPQAEQHRVSYGELVKRAGVSRDMVKSAIAEAIEGHFIVQKKLGRPNSVGVSGSSATFELKWDERGEYVKDPRRFRGFFAGQGNRTYIPDQFFDHVIPTETLAVIKVVGSIIRCSIGFQNKWGHRRQFASLSYQHIARYAHLRDRSTLAAAIRTSIARNYVQRVEDGVFDPHGHHLSRPATYTIKWLNSAADLEDGRKTRPEESGQTERSENQTGNGRKTRPAERSEIQTDIQITDTNDTLKQHPDESAVAFERLRTAGFDAQTARRIADRFPLERIDRQLVWIDRRHVKRNRLGMLRSAIEHDWSAPTSTRRAPDTAPVRESGGTFEDALQRTRDRLLANTKSS